MELSITAQAQMFLYALLLGAVVGVAYDVFRVLRRAIAHSWLWVLLEDALFFLLCTVILITFFLTQGGGEVRIFTFIGMVLGWVLYFFTVGSLVVRFFDAMVAFTLKVCAAIAVPLYNLLSWTKKCSKCLIKPLYEQKNRLKSGATLLYNNYIHGKVATPTAGGTHRCKCKGKKERKRIPPSTR